MTRPPDNVAGIVQDLIRIVGAQHVLVGDDVRSRPNSYGSADPMLASCVVRPANTEEVSRLLSHCNRNGLRVVPQGGRTGLVGGTRTCDGDVAISLERMRAISIVDVIGATMTIEAGATLERVQMEAKAAGLLYAIDLGARGSATMGGTIATNAGGNSVLRYGMTREQVLGLEVVLADGTVIDAMNVLIKNNAGYDVKQLFIGAEGTLGVITKAVVRLHPDPGAKATAFVGVASFDKVLALLRHTAGFAGGTLTSFEVMWSSFVDVVSGEGSHRCPLAKEHSFYVLAELASSQSDTALEEALVAAWDNHLIEEAVVAQSQDQAASFWALREDSASLIRSMAPLFAYDVSVPLSEMASYIADLEKSVSAKWKTGRVVAFGHIADGNLHIGVHTGNTADHSAVDKLVYEPLQRIRGSVSAEHGIGVEKRRFLPLSRSSGEITLMKMMKSVLDPCETLNPGKILE